MDLLLSLASVARFHVADFLMACINSTFLRSISKRFVARLYLAGPVTSLKAPAELLQL
jgi:hypothetical protein